VYLKLNVCEIKSQRYSTAHRVYKGTQPMEREVWKLILSQLYTSSADGQ